jgi:hypothetical protein
MLISKRDAPIKDIMKKTSVQKNCLVCAKVFEVKLYRINTAKCCSFKCSGIYKGRTLTGVNAPSWKGGGISIICGFCNKEFFDKPNRASVRRHCSKECQNNARRTVSPRPCFYCGIEFKPAHRRKEAIYCSRKCYMKGAVGKNAPRWLGGKSFEPYPVAFNKEFKTRVRERDNYTCAICGEYGNVVHHINYVKMDTFPKNCIIVCSSCHIKTNTNREYWIEYFANRSHERTPMQM